MRRTSVYLHKTRSAPPARVPPLLDRADGVVPRRPGDDRRAPARRRARARRDRGRDGSARRRRVAAEPAVLAARRRAGRPPRTAPGDDDRHRRPARRAGGQRAGRVLARRAHAHPPLRGRVPGRLAVGALRRGDEQPVRGAAPARGVRRRDLAGPRLLRVLMGRRPERRRRARAGAVRAGRARRRRGLVPRVGVPARLDPPARARRRAGAARRHPGGTAVRRPHARAARAVRGRHRDELLLHDLLRAAAPVRGARAAPVGRDDRARARRRGGRRAARHRRHAARVAQVRAGPRDDRRRVPVPRRAAARPVRVGSRVARVRAAASSPSSAPVSGSRSTTSARARSARR